MVVSSCACRAVLHAPQSLPHAHAPRSMSCVSCSVVYDLCSMAYVHDLCFILCPLLHAPLSCSMFHVPCFMLHDPRAIPHAPWSLRYVSCSTLHDLPFMLLHVSWPMAHGCYSFKIFVLAKWTNAYNVLFCSMLFIVFFLKKKVNNSRQL